MLLGHVEFTANMYWVNQDWYSANMTNASPDTIFLRIYIYIYIYIFHIFHTHVPYKLLKNKIFTTEFENLIKCNYNNVHDKTNREVDL